MPELPEVHTFQQYFNRHAINKCIEKVEVSDHKIIRNVSAAQFKSRLRGKTFVDSYRRGKYLFGQLDDGHHLLLHFGMTGDLVFHENPKSKSRHERFAFIFTEGGRLSFDCPRKFARILYLDDLEEYLRAISLGEDALEISEATFLGKMQQRKTSIKSFFLNQKNLAGMGNLYVDELCYQCKIHPASPVNAIPTRKKKQLFATMKEILQFAIARDPHYKSYPENWFWQWRQKGAIGPGGNPVVQDTIAGRSTFYVENYQKKY